MAGGCFERWCQVAFWQNNRATMGSDRLIRSKGRCAIGSPSEADIGDFRFAYPLGSATQLKKLWLRTT